MILHYLDEQPLRFKELERQLAPIPQTTYNQIPPKVEYSLSELGILFKPVLDSLEVLGKQYISPYNSSIPELINQPS